MSDHSSEPKHQHGQRFRRTARISTVLGAIVALALTLLGATSAAAADGIHGAGEKLNAGERWSSADGRVFLLLQGDGNLVLYGPSGSSTLPLWSTQTYGDDVWAVMQHDGNFVVYDGDSTALWNSESWTGDSGSTVKVQDDGKLVIYDSGLNPVWQNVKDCGPVSGPVPSSDTAVSAGNIRVHTCLVERITSLQAAAWSQGVTLGGWGWRSHEQQIELRRQHCGTSDYAIYEMPAGQCSPPTARPGASMHERGLAVDFTGAGGSSVTSTGAEFAWLSAHAGTYGLSNLPSEPWHWSTNGR